MRRSLAFASIVITFGTLALLGIAHADDTTLCVPQANGVPGKGGPPAWTAFDTVGTWTVNKDIADARWRGASGHTIRSGSATAPLDFRALYTTAPGPTSTSPDEQYVELSWQVNVAAIGSAHMLYVGFMMPGDLSSATMIRFHFPSTPPDPLQPAQPFWQCYGTDADQCPFQCADGSSNPSCPKKTAWYEVYKYTTNCDHDPSTTTVPNCDCTFGFSGFTNAAVLEAVDVAPEWIGRKDSSVTPATRWLASAIYTPDSSGTWTLRVRVPVDASAGSLFDLAKGIRAGAQIWYEAPLDITGGPVSATSPHQQWPRLDSHGACFPDADPSRVEIPSPLTFGGLELDASSYDPGFTPATALPAECRGVSISSPDIHVVEPDGTSGNSIWGDVNNTPPPGTHRFTNQFTAVVHNDSNKAIDANTLTATFRIADWGSQVTPWGNQPDYPSGVWDTTPSDTATPNPVKNATPIAMSDIYTMSFAWTLTDAQMSQYGLNPLGTQLYDRHECMLVELSGSGGTTNGDIDFQNRSAFTNMEFGSMSKFEQFARISASKQYAGHDVYLVLMPKNMPHDIQSTGRDLLNENIRNKVDELAGEYGGYAYGGSTYGGQEPGQMPELLGHTALSDRWVELAFLESVLEGRVPKNAQESMELYVQFLREGVSVPTLSELLPSVDVYAYVDTGETYSSGKTTHRVLAPMSSFGYDLWHDGDVRDFVQVIDNAEKIAPNVYRVHTDSNGNAIVKVASQAVQAGEAPISQVPKVCGGCCNPKCPTHVGLTEAAPPLFAGVFAFRRRKKRG